MTRISPPSRIKRETFLLAKGSSPSGRSIKAAHSNFSAVKQARITRIGSVSAVTITPKREPSEETF